MRTSNAQEHEKLMQQTKGMSDRDLAIHVYLRIQQGIDERSQQLKGLIRTLTSVVEESASNREIDPIQLENTVNTMISRIVNIVECQIENDANLVKVFDSLVKSNQALTTASAKRGAVQPTPEQEEPTQTDIPTFKDHTIIFEGEETKDPTLPESPPTYSNNDDQ